jgi:hypothetical protein
LSGHDINSRPDRSASKWVINFSGMEMDQAASYPDVFSLAEREVKPFRLQSKNKSNRDNWWRYEKERPALLDALHGLKKVIVIAQTSGTQLPVLVPNSFVFDQQLVVFPVDSYAELAFRSSEFQFWWTVEHGSKRTSDKQDAASIVYTPTTCCTPLPLPDLTDDLAHLGKEIESLQKATNLGLTQLSQLINSSEESGYAFKALRDNRERIDQAVLTSYGWDIDLEYGFHETRRGIRYTMSPCAQGEVLDRLLELNHARYKEESDQGLHTPEAKRRRAAARKAKAKARAAARSPQQATDDSVDDALFPQPDALF